MTCSTDSNIVTWKVNNRSVSAITDTKEVYSYTIVPALNGWVFSTLVLNSSVCPNRSGRREVQCCDEKQACQSIQLQHNGMCFDEITPATIDHKSTTIEYSGTSTATDPELVTKGPQTGMPGI